MTTFGIGKKKRDIALAPIKKNKSSKNNQRQIMKDRFKTPKAETEEITMKQTRCSLNVAPKNKKGRRSSLLKVGAKVERLEEKVAAKKAETILMRQQLMEGETEVESTLQNLSQLRMVNALLFLDNLCDQGLLNQLTRRILG